MAHARALSSRPLAVVAIAFALLGCGCGSRRALSPPSCIQAVADAPRLRGVPTTLTKLPASPFGVVSSAGFSFVTVGGYTSLNELWVFRDGGLHPRLVRRLPLPIPGGAGEAVTPAGRLLLVAAGSGATVVDVRRARSGAPAGVLGSLQAVAPNAQTGTLDPRSAIEVVVSRGGAFAFVSLEYLGTIAVFDLRAARASGWRRSGFRGMIRTGLVDVGLARSPDGKTLSATRDVRRAETHPATAVVQRIAAGCDPVRVVVTADGETVWVTARESDSLLGFSASKLVRTPRRALVREVRVGEAPVGLALLDGGRRIVVLNSNRFGVVSASSALALVDGAQGKLLGTIRAGAFPREAATSSDGRALLVTNWSSQELEAVGLGSLPLQQSARLRLRFSSSIN